MTGSGVGGGSSGGGGSVSGGNEGTHRVVGNESRRASVGQEFHHRFPTTLTKGKEYERGRHFDIMEIN